LQEYTERIQVDGEPIPQEELVTFVEEVKPYIAAIPQLTTFEITTVLAFLYFARRKVDAAVIEVGLGGRLDATNIVTPMVTVITSLSYDHTYLLGDTLTQIAAEKAGIIKPGIPVVSAPQTEEALHVIARIAAEQEAPLIQVGQDYQFEALSHSLDGQSFRLRPRCSPDGVVTLTIPLLGIHQVENATTAYAALRVWRSQGLPITENAIRRGFSQVVWPGRFEVLRRDPPIVVDSAHNRDSALRLRQALDDYFPGQPVVLVFGASEDKDVHGMFAELLPRVRQMVATKSIHPRAAEPEQLLELANHFGCPARAVTPVEEALEQALQLADGEALVLVAGSLFVAAGVREAWQKRMNLGQ
jgi:dihydrofolate synthase/folylpolyglutamate synthase